MGRNDGFCQSEHRFLGSWELEPGAETGSWKLEASADEPSICKNRQYEGRFSVVVSPRGDGVLRVDADGADTVLSRARIDARPDGECLGRRDFAAFRGGLR